MTRFPFSRSRWTPVLLGPFGAGRAAAELDDGVLRVGMGVLGSARIPVELISDVGTLRWPWWGGLGVRIARGMTAFVTTSGPAVFIDLSEPVSVRAPLKWPTRKIALGVEDVEGLIAALVEARGGALHRLPEAP